MIRKYLFLPCILLSFQLISQEDKNQIIIDSRFQSDLQVSNHTFNKLIFSDLNFLILGDDTPQEGINYEYKDDLSSFKLSGYLTKLKFKTRDKGFITIDGEFKSKNGIYFFDKEKGGSQAKITGNLFFLINSYRKFDPLYTENNDTSSWDIPRQQAYIRANYRKVHLLQDLYSKYKALAKIAQDANYPIEDLIIKDSLLAKAEPFLIDHQVEFDLIEDHEIDLSDYKSKYSIESNYLFENKKKLTGKEKREKKEEVKENNEEFENYEIVEQDVSINKTSYDLSKVFTELKKVKNKIDSVAFELEKIETDEAKEIWNSKHIWYMGVSPFYARESLDVFRFDESLNTSDQFKSFKKDLYGININVNYFTQNKRNWFNRFYLKLNFELSKASNFNDLPLSNMRVTDSIGKSGDGNLLEVVTEKKAYIGTDKYLDASKAGVFLDGYCWILNDFGIFSTIGFNRYSFNEDKTYDNDKIPWRLGLMYEFKKLNKPGKIAVIQAFLDRNDLQNHPQQKDENIRFGFKIGIPINVRTSL